MPDMQFILIGGGVLLTLVMLGTAFSGPSTGKSHARRLDGLKQRNSDAMAIAMESQLRKITANRDSALDVFASKYIPNPALLRKRIEQTGKNWTVGKYAAVSIGIIVVVTILATIKGAPIYFGLAAGLALGLAVPHICVGSMIKGRVGKFNAKFPDAIDLMVRGLRSGLPISETLGIVASEVADPVGIEFRGVSDRMRIGKTMEASLQESADRIGTAEFQFFCITLAIQRETGGNLAETLANLSEVLRKRAQMKLKIKAMSSEAKASAYIIGAMPFMVFIMIYLQNPPYMLKFFTDQRLELLGLGGLGWMSIGAFTMKQMINFEI
jgi:tight adherence protein B